VGLYLPQKRNPLLDGISLNVPGIPARINFEYFFDRADIQKQMDAATRKALSKIGLNVMYAARRSILKRGMAKAKPRIMKENPGISIRELLHRTANSDNRHTRRQHTQLLKRLYEIREKPASPPGTPPHTHKGTLRKSIVFAYDPSSQSVVVGTFMQGIGWIASLHEFGGSVQQQAFAFVPRWPNPRSGLLAWMRVGTRPRDMSRWEPTRFRQTANYPRRSFMGAAMLKMLREGKIPAAYQNRFGIGGLGK
jgi:hypothetical protein